MLNLAEKVKSDKNSGLNELEIVFFVCLLPSMYSQAT